MTQALYAHMNNKKPIIIKEAACYLAIVALPPSTT
jgi:hypothetical protein